MQLLRLATLADAKSLAALHVSAWHETYAAILPDEILSGLSVDAREKAWATILESPTSGSEVYVAVEGGRLVAFGAACPQVDPELEALGYDGEISAIYVRRSHQRRGIGRQIMQSLAHATQNAGRRGVTLWVLSENSPARSFYEHLGGRMVKERTDQREHTTLFEVAYGWNDLSSLL